MKRVTLGPIGEVSRLTLGGGGLGGVWGPTTREEAIAMIRAAVDAGIDLLDAAPGYRAYESVIGEAFGGRPPEHVRITSKYGPGSPAPEEVYPRFRASIETSLTTMKLDRLDVFFLHNEICPDDVDTLIQGVKNRRELDQVLAAETAGPLEPERIAEIDGLRLRE